MKNVRWKWHHPNKYNTFPIYTKCLRMHNLYLYRNAMDSKAGTLLVPPNVKNVSCSHPRYTGSLIYYIGPFDAIQALLILMLTVGIIGANLLVIFVINHRRYSPYIHPQVCFIFQKLFCICPLNKPYLHD